jgi:hypothetical protein
MRIQKDEEPFSCKFCKEDFVEQCLHLYSKKQIWNVEKPFFLLNQLGQIWLKWGVNSIPFQFFLRQFSNIFREFIISKIDYSRSAGRGLGSNYIVTLNSVTSAKFF